MHADKNYTDQLALEIIELHRFHEEWFSGRCEESHEKISQDFLENLDESIYIISAEEHCLSIDEIYPIFKTFHGSSPEFKISIRNVQRRSCSQENILVVTYEEWQMNAEFTLPLNHGRLSTAIFIKDESRRNGLRWAHLHEVFLPAERIEAEAFDW